MTAHRERAARASETTSWFYVWKKICLNQTTPQSRLTRATQLPLHRGAVYVSENSKVVRLPLTFIPSRGHGQRSVFAHVFSISSSGQRSIYYANIYSNSSSRAEKCSDSDFLAADRERGVHRRTSNDRECCEKFEDECLSALASAADNYRKRYVIERTPHALQEAKPNALNMPGCRSSALFPPPREPQSLTVAITLVPLYLISTARPKYER